MELRNLEIIPFSNYNSLKIQYITSFLDNINLAKLRTLKLALLPSNAGKFGIRKILP